MKAKLMNNLGLKTASVLIAFLIWLLVVNVSNPEVTRTQEVALEIVNDDVLLDADRTYTLSRKTVAVSYDIHTMDEYKIRPSDFRAYIDLSELYDVTGSVEVKVEAANNVNLIRNLTAKPRVVRIETEEMQVKDFKLVGRTTGRPMEGYSVHRIALEPQSITVEGPMSQVGLINAIGIDIDVSQEDSLISGTAEPVFYDANGNALDLDRVVTNLEEISYQVFISKIQMLPLQYEVSGSAAPGYQYTECTSDISMIAVGGDEAVIAATEAIVIPGSVLNIDGASDDRMVSVDLRSCLPEGITLGDRQNPFLDVMIHIEPLASKTVNLSEADIALAGADPGMHYLIIPSRMDVTAYGLEDELRKMRGADLGALVDVKGLVPGTYDIPLEFQNDEGFEVPDPVIIRIQISDQLMGPASRNGEEEDNSEDSTETESAASES